MEYIIMLTMKRQHTGKKQLLNENEEKELVHLAPLRALLIRKEKIKKTVNTDETIFYLKSMY